MTMLVQGLNAAEKKYPNGDVYDGALKANQPEGEGTMIYNDGSVYAGTWSKGKRNGQGTYSQRNGNRYEGYWVNDVQEGEGTFFLTSMRMTLRGTVKAGQFIKGTVISEIDGFSFEGTFEPEVSGKLNYGNSDFCDGKWEKCNVMETMLRDYVFTSGLSYKHYNNGDFYVGNVVDTHFSKGMMSYANGDKFEGSFDEKNNFVTGSYKYGDGSNHYYDGTWKNGEFYNGKLDIAKENITFKGEWKDGKAFNGEGEIKDETDSYKGKWLNGEFAGTCKVANLNQYGITEFEGIVSEDTLIGKAQFPNSDFTGTLVGGKKVGLGSIKYRDVKDEVKGVWTEDVLVKAKGSFDYNSNTYIYTVSKDDNEYKYNIRTATEVISSGKCEAQGEVDLVNILKVEIDKIAMGNILRARENDFQIGDFVFKDVDYTYYVKENVTVKHGKFHAWNAATSGGSYNINGVYKDGKPDGIWTLELLDDAVTYKLTLNYKDGEIVGISSYDFLDKNDKSRVKTGSYEHMSAVVEKGKVVLEGNTYKHAILTRDNTLSVILQYNDQGIFNGAQEYQDNNLKVNEVYNNGRIVKTAVESNMGEPEWTQKSKITQMLQQYTIGNPIAQASHWFSGLYNYFGIEAK